MAAADAFVGALLNDSPYKEEMKRADRWESDLEEAYDAIIVIGKILRRANTNPPRWQSLLAALDVVEEYEEKHRKFREELDARS